jgi:hypothetical protein
VEVWSVAFVASAGKDRQAGSEGEEKEKWVTRHALKRERACRWAETKR